MPIQFYTYKVAHFHSKSRKQNKKRAKAGEKKTKGKPKENQKKTKGKPNEQAPGQEKKNEQAPGSGHR